MKMYMLAFATLLFAAGSASADVENHECNREFSKPHNEAFAFHFCNGVYNNRQNFEQQYLRQQKQSSYGKGYSENSR